MVTNEAFKKEWVKCYLQTHSRYTDQEITEAMIKKWVDGINKSVYVSYKLYTDGYDKVYIALVSVTHLVDHSTSN